MLPPWHVLFSQQPWQLLGPHKGPPSGRVMIPPPPAPPPGPPPMLPPNPPPVPRVMHSPSRQSWPGAQTWQINALLPHAATLLPGWQSPLSSQQPEQFERRQRGTTVLLSQATKSNPSARPKTVSNQRERSGIDGIELWHACALRRERVMSIAFFDLDKTLISVNSGRLWVSREWVMGRISKRQAARALLWLTQYRLGLATIEGAVAQALLGLKGTAASDIKDRSDALYDSRLRALFRPGALRALEEHRRRGDVCVLLTSSLNYLADRVGAELGFDAVLCNRLEVDGGLHTGRTVGPICFGEGKLTHARHEAQTRRVALGDCCFYTDSFSDLSVMEAVGRPVAVNPDPRLRRRARRKGWEIADWGSP